MTHPRPADDPELARRLRARLHHALAAELAARHPGTRWTSAALEGRDVDERQDPEHDAVLGRE